jgi:CheY-like chemotaxis protein
VYDNEGSARYQNVKIFEDIKDFVDRPRNVSIRPMIILLDIHVKSYDGFEMLQIMHLDSTYGECRVVGLTASVMNEEVIRFHVARCDSTMRKPFDIVLFPNILRRIQNGETI